MMRVHRGQIVPQSNERYSAQKLYTVILQVPFEHSHILPPIPVNSHG